MVRCMYVRTWFYAMCVMCGRARVGLIIELGWPLIRIIMGCQLEFNLSHFSLSFPPSPSLPPHLPLPLSLCVPPLPLPLPLSVPVKPYPFMLIIW